jgi:hypothetical protein
MLVLVQSLPPRGFIDEDQSPWVDEPLIGSPSFAVATYVGAILLACDKVFF